MRACVCLSLAAAWPFTPPSDDSGAQLAEHPADKFLGEAASTVARFLTDVAATANHRELQVPPAATTTTVTTTAGVGVVEGTDRFMRFITWIMDVMFLFTIMGICGAGYVLRHRIFDAVCGGVAIRPGRCFGLCRCENFLKLLQTLTCDCCGICSLLGYDSISAPRQKLTITLVGIYKEKKAREVYLQFSTDDINIYGKHSELVKSSRVQRLDWSGFADMKQETMDFDWYGDERGIYGLVREYGATNTLPGGLTAYDYQPVIGQIFVPHNQITTFAEEARVQKNVAPHYGARMFRVTPVKWKQPVASERALDGVTGGLMDTMKRAVHKNTPHEEIAELKFQNTNLQRQLAGQPPLERPPELGGATPDDNPANWANLVMRIELSKNNRERVASPNAGDYLSAPDEQINTWKSMTQTQYSAQYSAMDPGSSMR
jgi:hypothetical protein